MEKYSRRISKIRDNGIEPERDRFFSPAYINLTISD